MTDPRDAALSAVQSVCDDYDQGDPFDATDQLIREIRSAINDHLKGSK